MSAAQQSGEPHRDYSSSATWGDIEHARLSLEKQMAEMEGRLQTEMATMQTQTAQLESRLERQIAGLETRLIRWSAGLAAAAGVAIIGFLVGILQAVD